MKSSYKFFLLFLGMLLLSACNNKNTTEAVTNPDIITAPETAKINNTTEKTSKNAIQKDTIIQDFKIHYTLTETNDKIYFFQYGESGKKEKTYSFDKIVELDITKSGTSIFSNKISKYDFKKYIPNEFQNYQLSVFQIEKLSTQGIVFFINICKPDSDECYTFNLTVLNKDRFEISEVNNDEDY